MSTLLIDVRCRVCGTMHNIIVPKAGYKQWAQGHKHIQDAMPAVSAGDRELLLSQICPTCWDKMFREEE